MNIHNSNPPRKSHMAIGQIYFWTATINQWQYLLEDNAYKNIIIDSLAHLSKQGKIDVFAFVVMPNHLHMIWRLKEKNGREMPHASFLKYTAHEFRNMLIKENKNKLLRYAVQSRAKEHEFWKRDSLAVLLYTPSVAYQKLKYIHLNPVSKHWKLAGDPCDYPYSTAGFYEKGVKRHLFVKDLKDEFGW